MLTITYAVFSSSFFFWQNSIILLPLCNSANLHQLIPNLSSLSSPTIVAGFSKFLEERETEIERRTHYIPSHSSYLLFSSLTTTQQAFALDNITPPSTPAPVLQAQPTKPNSSAFSQSLNLTAPKPQSQAVTDLPEGSQWRYSEFLNAVKKGKVERVRFAKEGSALQLTAVDGRRASVVVPNDPDLIDTLAMNGVDISVSEGDSGGGIFNFIGNLLFPIIAFAGLFFLFRRGQGGPGGLGGPSKFSLLQELGEPSNYGGR